MGQTEKGGGSVSGPVYMPAFNEGPILDQLRKIQKDYEKSGKDLLLEIWKAQAEIDKAAEELKRI
jgi:hypothetical protein